MKTNKEDIFGWKMWEHGIPDSRIIVGNETIEYIDNQGCKRIKYVCECNCDKHTRLEILRKEILSGHRKSCGCLKTEKNQARRIQMEGWKMCEHGVPDSRLIVLEYVGNGKYLCECMCEEHTRFIAEKNNIKSGTTKSCGCLFTERLTEWNKVNKKKYNKYDLSGEYGIGWTGNTNEEFYFDLDDYDKIKDIYWNAHPCPNSNYIRIYGEDCSTHKNVSIAQVICGDWMDHVDRNTFNNRKNNLRPCTPHENACNRSIQSNNTSGIIGVSFENDRQKWKAVISVDKHDKRLGNFIDKEDAIRARLEAEAKYYGKFAPQRHLFEQYGIETQQND